MSEIDENNNPDAILNKQIELWKKKVLNALGIKGLNEDKKMNNFFKKEETKEKLKDILDKRNCYDFFFVIQNSPDSISFYTETIPLEKIKKKAIFFFSFEEDPFDVNNIESLYFVEVNKFPLEHMHLVFEEIFSPILNNSQNQTNWTDLLSKDLMEKMNSYISQMYLTIGLVKGKTLLPLPPEKILKSNESEKDKAHFFENSIIIWTKQIRKVLETEPENSMKQGMNPNPLKEIEFWKKKSENLNSIHIQLKSDVVKYITKILRESKSTYTNQFNKLNLEIEIHRKEANDNFIHLFGLEEYFQNLVSESTDFTLIPKLFLPIMHIILMIWNKSKYYKNASRIVVLIREICNAIIEKATYYISGDALLTLIQDKTSVQQACDKLSITIDICSKFKEIYFDYKAKANGTWKFPPNSLFMRIDSFLERCHDILNITSTIQQFNDLMGSQIGGTKGKHLTETVKIIYNEFNEAVQEFISIKYDIMDIAEKDFDDDFFKFRNKIKELERRMSSVITQSFDDSDTLIDKFKLLDSFDSLLKRPIIQDELEKKHLVILEIYKKDLKEVQLIFLKNKPLVDSQDDKAPIYNNLPPISGALTWAQSLEDRIIDPLKKWDELNSEIKEKEEYKDVKKMCESLLKTLKDYKESKILSWQKEVQESTEEKLEQTLLKRNERENILEVNFDPSLQRLLKEVKYFYQLEESVPEQASLIYSKNEMFRNQINKLDLIVNMYNFVVTTLNSVEEPLIINNIKKLDEVLEPGISEIKWKSEKIDDFLDKTHGIVEDVYKIVCKMKDDLEKIKFCLKNMTNKPMIVRKPKPLPADELNTYMQSIITECHRNIKNDGISIIKLIKEINDAVKINKKSNSWKNYQEFINDIVIDGISEAICCNLEILNNFFDPNKIKRIMDYQPLFDIKIELTLEGVKYDPEIIETNSENPDTIRNIIKSIINNIFKFGIYIQRIDTGNVGDYLIELKDNFEIRNQLSIINYNLNLMEEKCNEYKKSFVEFEIYWKADVDSTFEEFLNNNIEEKIIEKDNKDEEEIDEDELDLKNPIMEGVRTKIPPFSLFDNKISELKNIKNKISMIKINKEINWIKINAFPLKNSLENKIDTWINKYTEFLLYQSKKIITNCEVFNKNLVDGISIDPSEHPENKALLMNVIKILSQHKLVEQRITKNFQFCKDILLVLKNHNVDTKGDDFFAIIDQHNSNFMEISKKVNTIKSNILEIQEKEKNEVKKKIRDFVEKVNLFRAKFLEEGPFAYDTNKSMDKLLENYKSIDKYYNEITVLKQKANEYNDLENLFELDLTKFKQLNDCLIELEKLKHLWDMISYINFNYSNWEKTLWKQIKIDKFQTENESFQGIVKNMQKELRNISGYKPIENKVATMKKIINCIDMLNSDAMQERHWNNVSELVKSKIDFNSPQFCFKDLIKVNIQNYEKYVEEIAETAQKELKIGIKLNSIENNWSKFSFEFENFNEAGGELKIFKPFDIVQDTLDNDTANILNLLSQGKSVNHFKERLEKMKKDLNNIDNTINIWGKVQKNWRRLVNIFLLSEDIRQQLHETSKEFEQKNSQFREIMGEVILNPIIIETCTEEKYLYLQEIHKSIENCEKKLNIYLEQKKKAFSRFYFVSNQTLIDILSNGNNPYKITQEYLGDLFDGIKLLKIDEETIKKPVVKATAIESKDGEIVPFIDPFIPKDAVEIWLNTLEIKMRQSLEEILNESKKVADEYFQFDKVKEKKKMDWIKDFCAQISLVTVQIIWTEDVHKSFDEIEGGMTSAMKDCLEGIKNRIKILIGKVREDLSREDRNKIITIITIDVHSRDTVENLVLKNIVDKESFQWYSQLKFYWTKETSDVELYQTMRFPWEKNPSKLKCVIRIIDWAKFYTYEYVGNCGRLVITPLTDRCYITLTQALSLNMGGAPAGPAGTGKTETTKDLGRACGLPVFVFNCSEQMSTDSLGQIFMGLSQTGAWGCFDEFNRISIEVLSVVSTQVKQVLDALKDRKDRFIFMEDDISLSDTVGFFITMNPGYAGRTELPENLKALFRSCAMVVPDLNLICENMLMSEGYENAKELAKKFVTLYILSRSVLSAQKHYDWGLRAVKSVLRQAGKLKRKDPNEDENKLLMKALRDFNLPKIVTDDKSIFLELLKDLFPKVELEEYKAEKSVKDIMSEVSIEMKLINDENFINKCISLSEILEVRHCAFVIGPPGCGKSKVWQCLAKYNKKIGMDTEYDCLDPKAISANELFGFLTKSKEFKNGILSAIIKNQTKELGKYKPHHKFKWSILDGDIDPDWIESLNTVMDDNKVLTLVSNDRFPLTPSMRLLFEISNLKNATPATVSRAGVLFINENEIGWKPFFESWLESDKIKELNLLSQEEKAVNQNILQSVMMNCSSTYIENNIDLFKIGHECPVVPIMMIETTCTIIYDILKNNQELLRNKKEDDKKLAYEGIFIFSAMWGFGGSILEHKESQEDKNYDIFMRNWKSLSKIRFPEIPKEPNSSLILPIFDFYFDIENNSWEQWKVDKYEFQEDLPFNKIFVPTNQTKMFSYLLDLHIKNKKPLLFLGNAGTGKTAIINKYLNNLQDENILKYICNFNSKTSSESLQNNIMNSGLSKLGMRLWGLGSGRNLIFFIDDINMPYVDKYGTQSPIALIRQILDYNIIYDRDNFEEYNKLQDLYFCACLNPKAGSFSIELRLQRHFSVFAINTPNSQIIENIYKSILDGFFTSFDKSFENISNKIVKSTILVFEGVLKNFPPSAIKFHYNFNLRELSKIVEGIMLSNPHHYRENPFDVYKLWVHEVRRVIEDKLIDEEDIKKFKNNYLTKGIQLLLENTQHSSEENINLLMSDENLFTSFISEYDGEGEKIYLPIKNMDHLFEVLKFHLENYNANKAQMNLVLFNFAIEHICKICRIINRPNGNALLIGVGGSGKQSLTKLSGFLLGQDYDPLVVTSTFSMNELKTFLGDIYKKATKPPGFKRYFMINDSQIIDEEMLVFINDFLNSGYVPGIFTSDELQAAYGLLKNEARALGIADNPEELFNYFVDKIKNNIHLVLCMSPVGDTLRIRSRKFSGLINCTMINWFHSWPKEALYKVSFDFLKDIDFPQEHLQEAIALNMAETHINIGETNKQFLLKERRYNYSTPKSFLELIEFYKNLLNEKRGNIEEQIDSLTKGIITLDETQKQVKGLQEKLSVIMVDVNRENQETNILIEKVEIKRKDAEIEQEKANKKEEITNEYAFKAKQIATEAKTALASALPKLQNAKKSLEDIDPHKINEMTSFKSPKDSIILVGKLVMYLYKQKKYDLKSNKDNERAWKDFKATVGNSAKFKEKLIEYSLEKSKDMDENIKNECKNCSSSLDPESVSKASIAAYNLYCWVVSIIEYNEAYKIVAPLQEKSNSAEKEASEKTEELKKIKDLVQGLNDKVNGLEEELRIAIEKKEKVMSERNKYQTKLDAAEKLVRDLEGEYIRWTANVKVLENNKISIIGDSLLASIFISYIAPFSINFRLGLWKNTWIPMILEKKIPCSEGVEPLKILTNSAKMATWKNEGLPEDLMSLENATIITSCSRWPLIIDPQIQGFQWLKGHVSSIKKNTKRKRSNNDDEELDENDIEDDNEELIVLSANNDKMLIQLKNCVTLGQIVLIEGIQQDIDPLLEPLLSRAISKKGATLTIQIGGEDIEYDKNFKLYLQCKLSNPHFRPEISAQCTIVNFIVTEKGLEDQLLALVVRQERNELEEKKTELVRQQNDFEVQLINLEKNLLDSLSQADPETILDNIELIRNLNETKTTSVKIQQQTQEAKKTESEINIERNKYRLVASEGSMLYFLVISLNIVDHMYQYSLESFQQFFMKAIYKTEEVDENRITKMVLNIRKTVYQWISRGLFERHKIIFLSLLAFRLMQKNIIKVEWNQEQMNFLLNCTPKPADSFPLKDWLPNSSWNNIQRLAEIEEFKKLPESIEKELPARFKDWFNEINPENVKLPSDWRKLEGIPFLKLCVLRALRPDRMTTALTTFINNNLEEGCEFVGMDQSSSFYDILNSIFEDATNEAGFNIPIFFILSPGADPVKEVENLGKKLGFEYSRNNFYNIALGQGMDKYAESKLELGFKEGHWIMLQNIHLMPSWLKNLEKKLDNFSKDSASCHPNFRLYLSAEPNKDIPIGILEKCIKLTNEPPTGLKANMMRALNYFSPEKVDNMEQKAKPILFGLCYFHSTLLERRKFGPKGWNMFYPFNIGDLRDSCSVLIKNVENNVSGKIPFADLKYIFGEIMYGGHIVDDWDRRLCNAYLEYLMVDELCSEDFELFPYSDGKYSFKTPPSINYQQYYDYIANFSLNESPLAYGLHPNAEIGLGNANCEYLFNNLVEIQPKNIDSNNSESKKESNSVYIINKVLQEIVIKEKLFVISDIKDRIVEKGPYQNVFLQECEYMNILIEEINRSLVELNEGIQGRLTISEQMENLEEALNLERIPITWVKLAYPAKRSLSSWIDNLLKRNEQLNNWKDEPMVIPKVTRLNYLFNPSSFLTAIKQVSKKGELNKLMISTEFTKKSVEEIDTNTSKDGAYCYGFLLEGARWDWQLSQMEDSKPKEMFSVMPVCFCRSVLIPTDGREDKNQYICPVYRTENRGDTYIFPAQLKSNPKNPPRKWILAGVAIILDVEGISDEKITKEK